MNYRKHAAAAINLSKQNIEHESASKSHSIEPERRESWQIRM